MHHQQCSGAILTQGQHQWNNISHAAWCKPGHNLLCLPSLIPGFCLLPATLLPNHQLCGHHLPHENVWLYLLLFYS